jgi:hypothetical protein
VIFFPKNEEDLNTSAFSSTSQTEHLTKDAIKKMVKRTVNNFFTLYNLPWQLVSFHFATRKVGLSRIDVVPMDTYPSLR